MKMVVVFLLLIHGLVCTMEQDSKASSAPPASSPIRDQSIKDEDAENSFFEWPVAAMFHLSVSEEELAQQQNKNYEPMIERPESPTRKSLCESHADDQKEDDDQEENDTQVPKAPPVIAPKPDQSKKSPRAKGSYADTGPDTIQAFIRRKIKRS